jgi:hypothetical protein
VDAFLRISQYNIIIVLCACGLWLSRISTQAQTLTLNAIQSGELVAGASDSYAFTAQEGQMLSFIVTSDSLDSVIAIQNLDGDTLIANDDYNYPESRNALIEAFSAPYTGSYTLIVSGFGESSGVYDLLMRPGYSQIVASDTFDSSSNWQAVDMGSESSPELTISDGILRLTHEGIEQRAVTIGLHPETDVYYFQANFGNVSDNEGWRVGLVFHYHDALNYDAILLNHNGAWQMLSVTDGTESIMRDWGTHPAIRPGVTEFALSLLVNYGGYDVFYNEQFIGTIADAADSGGQVGFIVNTVSTLGSNVTAEIDEVIITAPVLNNGESLFPTTLVAVNNNYTVRELERHLLIPAGGMMALNIPESFGQQVAAGVNRFPIARESQFSNFVLGATVSWRVDATTLNGCGLLVRDAGDSNNYTLAYVDSTGGAGLSVREEDSFVENTFRDDLPVSEPPYQFLLIAVDDTIYFYRNGAYIGSVSTDITSGGIGEAVINFESTNTECRFTNLWVWTWE